MAVIVVGYPRDGDAIPTGVSDGQNPRAAEAAGRFDPVLRSSSPAGPLGDAIRRGEAIFEATNTHEAPGPYVGNSQTCSNCHLDAGALAESAPMWAAYVAYPAHRAKNHQVNTCIERLQGCFKYQMNAQAWQAGGPPAADSPTESPASMASCSAASPRNSGLKDCNRTSVFSLGASGYSALPTFHLILEEGREQL